MRPAGKIGICGTDLSISEVLLSDRALEAVRFEIGTEPVPPVLLYICNTQEVDLEDASLCQDAAVSELQKVIHFLKWCSQNASASKICLVTRGAWCVSNDDNNCNPIHGAIWGGYKEALFKMCNTLAINVDIDLNTNYK